MKLNNLLLPHPVLGQSDDIDGDVEILDLEIEYNDSDYTVTFKICHENGTISDYVKTDKAIYCCEVSCRGTLYRELFTSNEPNFNFDLKRTSLRSKVEFQVYCLASTPISNYSNPSSHSDYDGFIFELEKGDLLANFGGFDFNADVEYHKLKAASSFMEILPNVGDEEFTVYVWESRKIQIWLPKKTYDIFKQDYIGKRKEYSEIIHASLVQNALTVALYNFDKALEQGDSVWADSIRYRLLNEPELNHGSDEVVPENIPRLVQRLLGKPNDRLIDRLESMSNVNEIE